MTRMSHSSPCSSVSSLIGKYFAKAFFVLAMVTTMASAAFAAPAPTRITLAISATSVPYQTPIILTATVTSGGIPGSPVTAGIVLFCEATAIFCENNSALGVAQLTFPGATASVKLGSGPIGNHSYKAVFRANKTYASSLSNTVTYAVTGTYLSTISLTSTGSIGNYSLTGTVKGLGSLTTGPTGTISFLDASNGNNVLGTENLVVSTLATTFVQNKPFAIGGPGATQRSAAIASAYLNTDNNLDVVTGDAGQTISVLLGHGDGTFLPKVNYPGCTVGKVLQIVLADFNRDGNTDIALGCSDGTNGGLLILLGNGDGSFLNPVLYPTGDVASIAMGDFNSDGLLDFAVTDNSQQNVIFFTGNGDGTFTKEAAATLSTGAVTRGIVVADFNQDGKDDIAYALASTVPGSRLFDLYIALGNGDGTFQQSTTPVATQIGEFLTAGDTNADNKTDVIAATITQPGGGNIGNSLFVLLGNGNGTFQTPVAYVSDIPSDPHLADVNGDGIPDIIAGGSTGALVYQGNGDGTFQAYQEPTIGGFALTYAVNAGDYNNDGNADLIGTDADTPRAAVSLSQVQQTSVASALTSVAVFPLGSGIHNVDARYSGDSIYVGSLSTTVPLTAAPVNTSLSLTTSPTIANLSGLPVTLTAVLSPFTVGPPTTTTDGELVNFFSGATLLGPGTLSNGVATLTTTGLVTGSDSLTAVFPGDANYNPSTSNLIPYTVSDILLSSSLNPSIYQQSVTFTATLGSGKTGTVNFLDGATFLGTANITGPTVTFTTSSLSVGSHKITAQYNSSTSPVLVQVVNKATPTVTVTTSGPSTYGGTVTITATVPTGVTGTITFTSGGLSLGSGTIINGTVSITTTALAPPSDVITATYGGDTNYNSAVGTTTQTVAKADSSSTLTSSLNPSLPGASVTFTDTLPSNVTGTVTFTSGATTLGTSTVTGGVATVTTSTLPLGNDPITATYSGDGNFNSSVATLTQNVAKTTPTVTVSTSGTSIFGHSVTITASVPNGPTGTITITSGGVTLGSGTITSSNGTVTITTTVLPVGSDLITATYSGDATNNTATGTTTQIVTKASPTETIASSTNPSTFNQSVTFTATLPTNVTGTVTFTSGATTLGTSTVTNGVATLATSALPVPSDSVTATYNGDANNNTATASLTQTVNKATPAVTVTTSGPSTFGGSVTITTTLPIGTTGTVTVTSGGVTLGSGPVNPATGTVTITTTVLPVGNDPITATYGGDTNNNPATGMTSQTVTRATPVVTVASSTNPSTSGQSVTFTATLPSGVTGTVTFTSGATALGTSTLSGGAATATTAALPVGNDPVTATYNGDGNYNSATGTLTQVVNKPTPTITVTTSGPSIFNNPVTITTTLPPGTTGTVTIASGGTTLGSGPVNPTTGTVTITTSTLPVGNDPITATYGGDTNNGPATGTTTQTVSRATTTVSLTSSLNPSSVNQSVTFTATVPAGVTGTVTFLDGSTSLGTGTISNGTASFATSTLNAGVHSITASYGGDTNYSPAVSAPLSQTVNKATPVLPIPVVSTNSPTLGSPVTITETVPPGVSGPVTFSNGTTPIGTAPIIGGVATITVSNLPLGTNPITASTPGDSNNNPATSLPVSVTVVKTAPTVTVTSSLNPSIINQPVTFTATAPAGATGTITFFDGSTILGTGTLTSGQATLTTSTLIIGSHTITVSYGGDTNNSPATSVPLTQIVNKATPVIPPPVVSAPNTPVNTPETITETVPPGVTGTVTFSNGTTPIGTAPIVGGVATITVPSLPAGTDPITATTSGDANNNPATSTATIVTVTQPTPVLVAPIVTPNNPAPNTPVTITEPIPSGVTGPVTFTDGTTILGTAPIVNGQATLTVPSLPVGTNQITATATNTATSGPITSPPTTVTVAKATVVITLASSANPSAPGQAVTFLATLPAGATGSVTFLDGATVLGVGTINAAGTASFTTSALAIGSHPITASYAGDTSNSAATSAVLTQVVGKIPTVTTIVVSAPAQLLHTGVTFTANVTAPSPNATGTVTFMDGTTILGTAPLSANGGVVVSLTTNANAAFATTALLTGPHQIVAVYSGDNTFLPSTSAPAPNMVEDFTNANTGAASQNVFPGASTTYTFTLTPVGASTFLNDVTVDIDGLPKGSTYTFSPATIKAGSGATQVTLTVQTSSALNARNNVPQDQPSGRNEFPIALGMLGLAGLGAVRKLRRRIPRSLMVLLLTLGSLLPIAALSGCAGGYFLPKPTTFPLTVTGTEGVIQHAATATLIVEQ
jgi:Bacterial Ig-like domain (group 3)/FG-GAP-like repeat